MIKGLLNLTRTPYQRLTKSDVKFIPTGIDSIDNELNDLESKRVTLFTGRPGEGKSTVVHRIALNAIDNNHRVLLVDGEHDTNYLVNNLYTKVIGHDKQLYDLVKYNKKYIKEPKKHVLDMIENWHRNKLLIYSKSDGGISRLDELFEMFVDVVKKGKIDLVILDNLMSLLDSQGADQNEAQSIFMRKCHDLAVNYNCHIILVAHPNKGATKGESIDYYQISGTADLVNLADNIIQVRRVEEGMVHGYAEIHKNRGYGTYKKVPLHYYKDTNALYEIHGEEFNAKLFNWKREGTQTEWQPTDKPF